MKAKLKDSLAIVDLNLLQKYLETQRRVLSNSLKIQADRVWVLKQTDLQLKLNHAK